MRIEARAGQIAWRGIQIALSAAGVGRAQRPAVGYYLLVTGGNVPGALAAEIVGCSRQNVSKLLRKVEDRRDDPEFNAVLDRLERRLFGEV